MASCHNSLGGYGILPYPLRPLNILRGCSGLRCSNRDSIAIFPQVSWEFACVSPPTDFTDLHRWLGCVCSPTEFTEFTEVLLRLFSHGIHRIHRSFVASVLPQISRICTDGLVALIRPRNSQNSQKFCCVGSPTEFTEFTEVWGCCWLRGYGRMPYPPNLCASVRICGRCFSTRRVSSVGDYSFSMRKRLTMPKTRA